MNEKIVKVYVSVFISVQCVMWPHYLTSENDFNKLKN